MSFHIHVDIAEAAKKLNQTADLIEGQLKQAVGSISAATHAYILQTVNSELTGFKRTAYLGKENKNVRWVDLGNGMWVVEVDESARWLEEGRDRVFMDWLLKNAKTAKDGSRYKVIPFSQEQGAGKTPGFHPHKPALQQMTQKLLKENKINLKKIDRDEQGRPKVGIVGHFSEGSMGRAEFKGETAPNKRDYFSKPRSWEDSKNTGLPQHEGIFMLKGMTVVQTPDASAKHGVRKEAITYRVISSKHQQEGRWFYPKVEALNAVPRAAEWAQKELDNWLKEFEKSFQDIQGT